MTAQHAGNLCTNCGHPSLSVFYDVRNVPVHSVLLVRSRTQALDFPRGDIRLAFCSTCGFITNVAFDAALLHYSAEYEETQGFSATFNAFHRRLAQDLVDRYDLHGKTILEIGCGKGEFLVLLCELGGNRGVGFDPAYVRERNVGADNGRLIFIEDFYSAQYAGYQGDFVCCKMTLEHIHHPADFVGMVRRSIGDRPDTTVFFQVPEAGRILRRLAFWDVYYEHCSYFTPGALASLFRRQGFAVLNLWTDYDDQYLMIEARPVDEAEPTGTPDEEEAALARTRRDVAFFAAHIQSRLDRWRGLLRTMKQAQRRVVLWGGGSKAVSFRTTLGLREEIGCVVDINPYRQGTFLAGSGHEIVEPAFLSSYRPDVVLIMNPVYRAEIEHRLHQLGLSPEVVDVDQHSVAAPP